MRRILHSIPSLVLLSFYALQYENVVIGFRLYIIGLIVVGYSYYAEKAFQQQWMRQWSDIRSRGKAMFILREYILLRGGAVTVVLLTLLSMKVSISLLIVVSLLPLLAVMALAGSVVWYQCERDHQERIYKATATSFAVQQN